jgi:hypothetical protein
MLTPKYNQVAANFLAVRSSRHPEGHACGHGVGQPGWPQHGPLTSGRANAAVAAHATKAKKALIPRIFAADDAGKGRGYGDNERVEVFVGLLGRLKGFRMIWVWRILL